MQTERKNPVSIMADKYLSLPSVAKEGVAVRSAVWSTTAPTEPPTTSDLLQLSEKMNFILKEKI